MAIIFDTGELREGDTATQQSDVTRRSESCPRAERRMTWLPVDFAAKIGRYAHKSAAALESAWDLIQHRHHAYAALSGPVL
jgi:hypothetical protein